MTGGTVGHYEVLEQLGAGGMGIVYRARDPRLRREVALKVLRHSGPSSAAARSRLLREARAISALNHPNICTVYDIDERDNQTFIVMELVSGGPLTLHIRPGGMDSETVARWATQLADGLEHAHQQGVIHCDLKPSNIIVGLDGRVKLVDFGIAAREPLGAQETTESATAAETAQGLAGTPPYMAPEVIRGGAADARSDIWSLGVVLYELLSGKQPFTGTTPHEVTAAILRDSPPALPRHVPSDLSAIVGRCLSKDPTARYRRAGEVRAALDAIQIQIVRRGSAVRPKAILSVAVLPFANASLDPNLEYLSDGITESIINSLSQLPKLKVMARSTVFRYKGRALDPQAVGRDLGVRAVLTGQMRQIGDRLMISAELVNAVDGAQIWGEQYNRTLTDVLEVQQVISAAIVEKLCVRPTREQKKRLTRQHTVSGVAYQDYLKGRYHWNKRNVAALEKAIEHFEQAVHLDPSYAPALVGIADSYSLLPFYDAGPPMQFYYRAKTAATKALEIDEGLAEAHASLGHILLYYDWDWPAAERELKRAIEIAPNSSAAHDAYSNYLSAVGQSTEAICERERALELDPVSLPLNTGLGVMFYFARQYGKAIQQHQKTIDLDASYAPAHAFLGWAYAHDGMHEHAIAECQRAVSLADAPWMLASLGFTQALAGRRIAAEQVLDQLRERATRGYVSPYDLAVMYAAVGNPEQALAHLDAAYRERSGVLIWGLLNDPRLDGIRGEPAFGELMRRVGLAPGTLTR